MVEQGDREKITTWENSRSKLSGKFSKARRPSFSPARVCGMPFSKLPLVSILVLNVLDFNKSYSSRSSACLREPDVFCGNVLGQSEYLLSFIYKDFLMHSHRQSLNLMIRVFKKM